MAYSDKGILKENAFISGIPVKLIDVTERAISDIDSKAYPTGDSGNKTIDVTGPKGKLVTIYTNTSSIKIWKRFDILFQDNPTGVGEGASDTALSFGDIPGLSATESSRQRYEALKDLFEQAKAEESTSIFEIQTSRYGIELFTLDSYTDNYEDIQEGGMDKYRISATFIPYTEEPPSESILEDGGSMLPKIQSLTDFILNNSLADVRAAIIDTVGDVIVSYPVLDNGIQLYNSVQLANSNIDARREEEENRPQSSETKQQEKVFSEYREVSDNPFKFIKDPLELITRYENLFEAFQSLDNQDALLGLYEDLILNIDNQPLGDRFTLGDKNSSSFINHIKKLSFVNTSILIRERDYQFEEDLNNAKDLIQLLFDNILFNSEDDQTYLQILIGVQYTLENKELEVAKTKEIVTGLICIWDFCYLVFPNRIVGFEEVDLIYAFNPNIRGYTEIEGKIRIPSL